MKRMNPSKAPIGYIYCRKAAKELGMHFRTLEKYEYKEFYFAEINESTPVLEKHFFDGDNKKYYLVNQIGILKRIRKLLSIDHVNINT